MIVPLDTNSTTRYVRASVNVRSASLPLKVFWQIRIILRTRLDHFSIPVATEKISNTTQGSFGFWPHWLRTSSHPQGQSNVTEAWICLDPPL
jgi:hypothetical protein